MQIWVRPTNPTGQAQQSTKPNPASTTQPTRSDSFTHHRPYSIHLTVLTSPTTIYRPNCFSTSDATTICRPTSSSSANSTTYQSTAGITAPNNPADATGPAATTTTARD